MFDDLREQSQAADYEHEEESEELDDQLTVFINSFSAAQRFMLALMLFLSITLVGFLCLIVSGRIVI